MIISEATGLFLIPYGVTLGNWIWQIINESSAYIIPFIISLLVLSAKAIESQQSEGEASVDSLKSIEISFYSMMAVIVIFAQPMTNSQPSYSYKQVSCFSDGYGLIEGANTITDFKPTSPYLSNFANKDASIGLTASHQIGTLINSALISKMGCGQDMDVTEQIIYAEERLPKKIETYNTIIAFNRECYKKGISRVESAEQNGMTFIKPNGDGQKWFNSALMRSAYEGKYALLLNEDPVPFTANSQFITPLSVVDTDCKTAANEIEQEILAELASESEDQEFIKRYVQTSNNFNSTNPSGVPDLPIDARNFLVRSIYSNTLKPSVYFEHNQRIINEIKQREKERKASFGSITTGKVHDFAKEIVTHVSGAAFFVSETMEIQESTNLDMIDAAKQFAVKHIALLTSVTEAIKANASIRLMPTLISIVIMCMFIAAPLVFLLSGFKVETAAKYSLTMIAISIMPYMIEVGLFIRSGILGLARSEFSALANNEFYINILMLTGEVIVYILPMIWLVLANICLGHSVQFLAQFSPSQESAEKANQNAGGAASSTAGAAKSTYSEVKSKLNHANKKSNL